MISTLSIYRTTNEEAQPGLNFHYIKIEVVTMKFKPLIKMALTCATVLAAFGATAGGMNQDASYIGELLDVKPNVLLMKDGHELTNELDGQRMIIEYVDSAGVGGTILADFVDGRYIEFADGMGGDATIVRTPYAMFKIRKGVYFVTWVEAQAVQAPPPDVNWETYFPKWYGDDYQVSFVLDIPKGQITDAFMGPNHKGSMQFNLFQATARMEPITSKTKSIPEVMRAIVEKSKQ